MRRRSALALIGTALSTSIAGCGSLANDDGADGPTETPTDTPTETDPGPDPTPTPTVPTEVVNGSFEDGWSAWTVGQDLPTDPNYSSERPVAFSAGITTRVATDGMSACQIVIDGSQDDGTVWVQQPVDLSGYDYLAVDYQVSDSFNNIRKAAAYTGPEPDGDLVETDFDTSQALEGHEKPGWKTMTFDVDHDGPGLVAVGYSIVWETTARTMLDNVRLTAGEPDRVTPDGSGTGRKDSAGGGDTISTGTEDSAGGSETVTTRNTTAANHGGE